MSLKWRTAPCCCLSVFTFFPCSEHGVPANLQVWTSFSLGRVSSRFLQYCSLSMCAACWYLRLYYLDQHEAHSKAEREVHSSPQAPNTPQPPPDQPPTSGALGPKVQSWVVRSMGCLFIFSFYQLTVLWISIAWSLHLLPALWSLSLFGPCCVLGGFLKLALDIGGSCFQCGQRSSLF